MFRSPSNRRSHRANAGSASRFRPFLTLRRLARARLSTGCGDQTRQPRQTHDSAPAPERALATQPPSSRKCSIQDGDRCRQGKPAGTHSALSESYVGTTTQCGSRDLGSRDGLGQKVAANSAIPSGSRASHWQTNGSATLSALPCQQLAHTGYSQGQELSLSSLFAGELSS